MYDKEKNCYYLRENIDKSFRLEHFRFPQTGKADSNELQSIKISNLTFQPKEEKIDLCTTSVWVRNVLDSFRDQFEIFSAYSFLMNSEVQVKFKVGNIRPSRSENIF